MFAEQYLVWRLSDEVPAYSGPALARGDGCVTRGRVEQSGLCCVQTIHAEMMCYDHYDHYDHYDQVEEMMGK